MNSRTEPRNDGKLFICFTINTSELADMLARQLFNGEGFDDVIVKVDAIGEIHETHLVRDKQVFTGKNGARYRELELW